MPDTNLAYTIAVEPLSPERQFRSWFFDCVVTIAIAIEQLLGDDVELAELASGLNGNIWGGDVLEIAEWMRDDEHGFLISTKTWAGAAFAILVGCGLFRPGAEHGVYEVAQLRSDRARVRRYLLKLFRTLDAAGKLHPERFLSRMSIEAAQSWKDRNQYPPHLGRIVSGGHETQRLRPLKGSKLGPASEGRRLSPDEIKVVEEKLRRQGHLR